MTYLWEGWKRAMVTERPYAKHKPGPWVAVGWKAVGEMLVRAEAEIMANLDRSGAEGFSLQILHDLEIAGGIEQ